MSTKRIITPSIMRRRQAGDRAVQRADHDRDQRGEEADLERRLAAEHDPPELVEPVLVGPEQMRRRRSGWSEPVTDWVQRLMSDWLVW